MQNLAQTRDTLTVVNDQHGRPTWTRTLAEFMVYLVDTKQTFATIICQMMRLRTQLGLILRQRSSRIPTPKVLPVDSSQFPAKAKRPFNSTMSLDKAKATGFVIPTWQEALERVFYKQGK